jgi:hypothetical protein
MNRIGAIVIVIILATVVGFPLGVQLVRGQESTDEASSPPTLYDRIGRDFFAGLSGDTAAFERAMNVCKEALAVNPKDGEALVFLGAGDLYRAGQAFRQDNISEGSSLWAEGLKKMDEGVALNPSDPNARIARGMPLINCAPFEPRSEASQQMLEKGVTDLEEAIALIGADFNTAPSFERGEILTALVGGLELLGRTEEAKTYRAIIAETLAGTSYSRQMKE